MRSTLQNENRDRRVYADHASVAFNNRFHAVLQRLTADVEKALGDSLVALILGGGYGRGEGGVVGQGRSEQPYNDVDLILVVKRKRAVRWEALQAISQHYEQELKIAVDFSRPLTIHDIKQWPPWLMWYDLLHGHIVLSGPAEILKAYAPETLRQPLPLIEATRLLLNRGAGLLWAFRVVRGVEAAPDGDFVRRNYYKCALALGDAVLIARKRFTTPYRGRDERLRQIEATTKEIAAWKLEALYRTALQFKLRPDEVPAGPLDEVNLQALAQRWGVVLLYVETRRTGRRWSSVTEYTHWPGLREPQQHRPGHWPRNLLHNRCLGLWSWRYPRERLYRQLPLLLGLTESAVTDWPAASAGFLAVWQRFN